MPNAQFILGPPEVLWLDSSEFEHWTGRSAHTILRDLYPAGLAIYERNRRRFVLHSEYVAFLKATSTRKELQPNAPDHSDRFTRDARGRIAAVRR